MPKNISDAEQDKFIDALKSGGSETAPEAGGSGSRSVEESAPAKLTAEAGRGAEKPVRSVEEIQKEFDDYKSGEGSRSEAERRKFLEAFAAESPENWKYVYGPDIQPPDGLFDGDKSGKDKPVEPAKPGEDDLQEKRLAALEARERQREESAALEALTDRVEAEMSRHDEVFNREKNPLGPQLVRAVVSEVRRNPKGDLKTIVEGVAASFREYETKAREKYLGEKTKVAESIPAGVGKGSGAQPGSEPKELQWKRHGEGSFRDGLAAALRQSKVKTA
jgi:hypothetical protein